MGKEDTNNLQGPQVDHLDTLKGFQTVPRLANRKDNLAASNLALVSMSECYKPKRGHDASLHLFVGEPRTPVSDVELENQMASGRITNISRRPDFWVKTQFGWSPLTCQSTPCPFDRLIIGINT